MKKLISKRNVSIYWDKLKNSLGSLKLTLTDELIDLGIDPEKETKVNVSLVEENKIRKIIIEKIE